MIMNSAPKIEIFKCQNISRCYVRNWL